MFGLLALTFATVGFTALAGAACRSSCLGVSLSNGLEVMVDSPTHRAIEQEFLALAATTPDLFSRWDQAVLNILKPVRPAECAFLARSLNPAAALNRPRGLRTRSRLSAEA